MIWLSPDQLNELGISRRQLTDGRNGTKTRKPWTFRETGRTGRNGKVIKECLLESMGPDWVQKWLTTHDSLLTTSPGSLTTETYESPLTDREPDSDEIGSEPGQKAGAEDRLTQALKRYAPDVRDAFLHEAQRLASIVERYDGIQVKRQKVKGKSSYEFVSEVLALCDEARCTDPAILALEPARSKPRSPHTLDAWSKQFRIDGLATFLRKPSESSGNPRQTQGRDQRRRRRMDQPQLAKDA